MSRSWISPERTSTRQASEVDSFGSGFRRALILLTALTSICLLANADTTSSISGNFNGTAIAGGNNIWFTSVLKPSGLGSAPVTIYVRKSTISFTANGANYTISVPDANIVFNPNATTATTTFNSTTNQWDTTVPSSGLAGNTLLDAVEYLVPAGGLPGGIKNVTWQINFSTDTSGISLNWQWAAGVYPTFSTTYNSLGVKPVDDTKASQYQNSDHAGTPENYKSYVVGGATGGGASNYTGSLSATVSLAVPLVQAPTANAGGPYSGFIAQNISFNGGGSSDPNGDALTYSWAFGDGGTATGATPTHTYTAAGTFTVTLSVTDGRNATGTATSTATITAPPPPSITATQNPPPNAAGWNKTSVTVTFTCTDAVSGIKTCSPPVTVTTPGANQNVTGTAVNNAGESTPVTVKVSIDETPPTITATPSPTPNAGWNNTNVTVNFACGDTLSGIAQCPSPVVVSASGANQVVSGTASDNAGNSATATLTLNLELTLPSIVAVASPGPNANGWNNTNVTVSFTCTPSSSPITSCPSPQVVSTEGANQVISGTETDAAANTNTAKVTLNIGKTPPTIVPVISPPPNASGWNDSAVKVTFTCTPGTAPLATCPAQQTISTEGANQVITGTAIDVAGNSTTVQVPLHIAITPPTITAAVSPAANVNGWNNSNVTVTFTCTAAKAPIASCPPPQTVSTQGANQNISGTVTDVAGNSATTHVEVSIATTPPTITASVFPLPDAQGWNNSPVTVSFVCTNTVAPIASCPGTQVISAGGANQSVTGTATDVAGNVASASVTLNIGTVPPTMGGVISSAPNAAGWNNTNVTATWTCVPGTAPLALLPPPAVVSTEGANQVVTGMCTDVAGNSVSASLTVNIDKTPPTITATPSPAPNAAGWNNSSVTVTFVCSDTLSGVAICPPPQSVSTPGAGQIVRGTVTDVAGNSASAQFTVNISETRPQIIPVIAPQPNAAGWNNTNVTVSFTCTPGPGAAPITSCPSPQIISTEGASIPVSGTVTDAAGATATASAVIKLDKTPPTVTPNISPAPNSNGWETTPVTVGFTCSDSLSGVASCPSSTLLSSDGANQPVSGTATDVAGNTATASANVNLEQALPTISASVSPAANSAGWNNTAVTVTFTCHQSVSPIASCSPSQTVSTQGVGQVITGTVQDQAGNQSTTSVTLNITETSPSILQFTAPSQLSPGQSGSATLTVSDIASVASVVFQLNGTAIGTALAPPYTVNVTAPGNATSGSTLTLTAVVTDVAGNVASSNKGIQIVSSGVIVGQVLSDTTGLQLAGASVQVIGQAGEGTTSDSLGRYSIPVTSNQLFLSISQPGNSGGTPAMVTVERQVSVQSGVGTLPVDARLTAIAAPTSITGGGGTVGSGAITVTVPPGGASTLFYLTPLSQQGLPGLLPLGWSPVAAFDLRTNISNSAALTANFTGVPSGILYLVTYSYNVHAWNMVAPNLSAAGGSLTVALPSVGDYALVVPDAGNASIQIPAAGQPLTGVPMVALPTTATSSGSLSPANIAPTGGSAMASLAVQSNTPLPSGTVIQSEVTEKYTLVSGQLLSAEPRFEDILLYQTPASTGATVAASFPVTPSQTFQVSQLSSGDVHMDILSGRESVRGQTGGSDPVSVQSGDATLTVAAGSLSQDTAIAVTPETVDSFLPSTSTLIPVSEYSVDFSGQVLTSGAQLSVGIGTATPGSNVVIAQIHRVAGVPYLVAVGIAQVTATNIITQTTPGLSGITQGGEYVFYEITVPTGFVSGTVSASSGPVAATIQTDALPFVAFSNSNGNYTTIAAAGTAHLTASIPNTALAGTTTAQVVAGQTVSANLSVVGQVESATIMPANGAVGVPLTAEIDVTAADPFNPATVTPSSVVMTAAGNSTPVALRFVFSAGGAKLAVFPQAALQPSTQYTVQASGLANAFGGLISVPTTSFTTVAITAPTYNTNALVFGMPDSNGNVAISAPANSFPAGSTILIVDQTNGVVYSLTVFNDGSVTGQMPATINDILQVALTDPAGNVTNFTVSQFVAADGTTAIGAGGGTVTGPGGTGIIIPAGALNQGTTFKLALLDQSSFPQLPSWPGANFGSGMQITAPSMPSFNKEAKLAFPVPANAPPGAFYYVYRRLTDQNNDVLFETIDHAFVQGTGANAQVVTASPPFCGYLNSYGSFLAAANAGFQPLAAATTFTFMMWAYDPNQAGISSQGVIAGMVYQNSSTGSGVQPLPAGIPISIWLTNNPQYVTTTTAACGTYSLFDPQFGGGARNVTAQNDVTGQQIVAIAQEVDGAQPDDSLFSVTAGLEAQYRNIGRLNFTFQPAVPPPPPPQINIGLYTLDINNNRQPVSGVVQAGSPLTITFSSTLTVTGIAINGAAFSSVIPDAPPANPTPNLIYSRLNDAYSPSTPGLYTIVATALDPLNPQTPVTASRSFLLVAAGGGNNFATANTPPAVIGTVPPPNEQNVSTYTFPEITFSEPVTHVPGNVTLKGSPRGDSPALLLIGIRPDGSVANPVQSTDAITSLTIQPLTGLEFGEGYTLTLSSGIVNVGQDQNGNPIPQLPLSTYSFTFYTFGPQQSGGASSSHEVLTRPVVIGNYTYAGEYVNSTLSGLGVFDITDPTKPADKGVPVTFVGRAIDAVGLAASVTGGPLVAVASSTAQDLTIPGNVWLYDVTNPLVPVRAGGVSVTSSAIQAGVAVRLAMKDKYLYASTLNQGLQVIDLGEVISEYQQATPFNFGQAITTDGEGFAMDAIVNAIQLPIPNPFATPPPCGASGICGTATMFGLQADDFATIGPNGTGSQTLLVATGQLPLVIADPTQSGLSAVLYPGSSGGALIKASEGLQFVAADGTTYQLQQGRAVAMANIAITGSNGTTNKHVAVVVGTGTPTTTALLAVVDVSQPYTQGSPFTPQVIGMLQLFDQNGNAVPATDVTVNGNVAFVATGTNVLIVNLEDPSKPTAAGQITGTFGNWVTTIPSGYLVSTNNIPSNSIQTANLRNSITRPGTGHCKNCEDGAGLPINLTNGNVYVDQADYSLPGLGGGIQIARTWNSQWESSSPVEVSGTFGNSWRSTYDERLQIPVGTAAAQPIQYWLSDGTVWNFTASTSTAPPTSGQLYTISSPLDEHATLQSNPAQSTYTVTFTTGTRKIFNSAGYLTAMIDRNGNQTAINYDSANRITNVTDAAGRVLTFNYGPARQVQSIQDSVGVVATYSYDATAHLTKVVYADGSSVNMTYDPSDLLLSVTDGNGKILEAHTFDSARRGLTSTRANGVDSVTVQYTAEGEAQVVSSQNIATTYGSASFGGRSSVTSVTGPGCASCGGRGNGTFFYDGSGNRISRTDALGLVTTYSYDSNGNVLSSTTGTGSSAITSSYTYNNFSEVLTSTDPMGSTTTNTYDAHGNLLTVTSPAPGTGVSASVTQFACNSLGELTRVTDPLNHATAMSYTSAGLIATITDAQSNVTTYGYDSRGNRTSLKDALGNTTSFAYDAMNRLTGVTYPDSTTATFVYDYRGRRISATDQNGKITSYAYDDDDRLTSVTDAANTTTSYAYDSENNLLSITDANGHATTFTYDSLSRATQMTFPSGLVEAYTYDALSNLLTKTDRKHQTITYAYDQLNRLVQKSYPDTTTVTYTYDNDSRLTQVTDPTGTYQSTFDNMGRLTGTSTQYAFLSRQFATSYGFDAASNRTRFTDPEGELSTYAYDTMNRLQNLTPAPAISGGSFGFGYDALSRRTSLTRPNTVKTNYVYDSVSRLLSVTHQAGASSIDGATYTVDAAGNRTAKTDGHTGVTTNYGYDAIYQLLNATQSGSATENYSYDSVGNRLSSLGVPSYHNNVSNELVSTSNGTYTYDNNGNIQADPSGKTYSWDFDNRLTSVIVPGTGTVTFKYDPFGRRIQKTSALGTTNYVYDGADLVEEVDQNGNALARYTQAPGIDEPIAQLRSGLTTYYEADGLGSITSLTDASGAVANTYTYDSFGKLSSSTGTATNPFRYTGREFDAETGLYYYRARYYDPQIGRFISEDPIGFGGDDNFYAYVGNDPSDFSDAFGLKGHQGLACTLGGVCYKEPSGDGKYHIIHSLPPGSQSYTAPDGKQWFAPPRTNWCDIYKAGRANGRNPFAVNENVGQGGTYDLQRVPSRHLFITQYTSAANYAVGVYMNGAGYSLQQTILIGDTFAFFKSTNYKDRQKMIDWWKNGWNAANSGQYAGTCGCSK